MSIGTAAAVAIGASAGLNLLGAKMQSGAAKKAAKTQGQATQQAQGLQYQLARQAMAQQMAAQQQGQQLYAPYTQAGPQSLGALYSFLGLPGPPPAGPPQGGPPPPPGMGGIGGIGGTPMPGPVGEPGMAVPRPGIPPGGMPPDYSQIMPGQGPPMGGPPPASLAGLYQQYGRSRGRQPIPAQ